MILQIKKGLTSFQLKIIAMITMTIDHIADFRLVRIPHEIYEVLRIIGRVAAPLFLFQLVQGLRHTRSKLKYIFRLYTAGVIIQIINLFLVKRFVGDDTDIMFGNILPTFMYTALYITCIEAIVGAIKNKEYKKMILPVIGIIVPFLFSVFNFKCINNNSIGIFLQIFIPSLFTLEYSFLFVLLGIAWYFIDNKTYNCLIFVILSFLCYFIDSNFMIRLTRYIPFNFFELFLRTQWLMILAIPFMLLYNGHKGKSYKYLFYFYYPLHQYLIFFIIQLCRSY